MSEELERKNIDKTKIDLNKLSILDFGSGTGSLTERMSTKAEHIVAIDPSEKMIEVLKSKKLKNVSTVVGKLSKETLKTHPILQGKFDVIVASSVCAFLPNYEETLLIIKSLLSPTGIFIQWDWLRTEKDPDFGFTEEMIRKYYSSAGLKVDSISVPFHLMENGEPMEVIMAVSKLQNSIIILTDH